MCVQTRDRVFLMSLMITFTDQSKQYEMPSETEENGI